MSMPSLCVYYDLYGFDTERNHLLLKGNHRCTVGLLFDWTAFYQTNKFVVSCKTNESKPVNWRPANHFCKNLNLRTFTMGGSINVWLVYNLTGLDSTKQENTFLFVCSNPTEWWVLSGLNLCKNDYFRGYIDWLKRKSTYGLFHVFDFLNRPFPDYFPLRSSFPYTVNSK